jgi:hypothetical protein
VGADFERIPLLFRGASRDWHFCGAALIAARCRSHQIKFQPSFLLPKLPNCFYPNFPILLPYLLNLVSRLIWFLNN